LETSFAPPLLFTVKTSILGTNPQECSMSNRLRPTRSCTQLLQEGKLSSERTAYKILTGMYGYLEAPPTTGSPIVIMRADLLKRIKDWLRLVRKLDPTEVYPLNISFKLTMTIHEGEECVYKRGAKIFEAPIGTSNKRYSYLD